MREMTTKPPSGLAASGSADDADLDITKEQDEDGASLALDPSQDVTVEASEDVTMEAAGHTPPPSLRPGTAGVSAGQRAPTLLGVPIHSLPLPGVIANSASGETRTIDYDDEITVLAQPTPNASPLKAAVEAELEDELGDVDLGPSIVDDDEEETKVEAAESAMKAAESMDDVTTALSEQASLERDKALRRTAAPAPSDDSEFADPDGDEPSGQEQQRDEEESLDDELSDEDEVISAGGAIEEEEDLDEPDTDDGEDDAHDGVATATFMKSSDSTGLSGLLSPRRPPTGGRDGFGSRLPTPYSATATGLPAPATSPFASRLGPPPTGSPPYGTRTTSNTPMGAIQVPPPSGAATTATGPSFFGKQVPMPGVALLCFGFLALGFGLRGAFTGKSTPPLPTTIVAKPTAAAPAAPAAPVVEPVTGSNAPAAAVEAKPAVKVEAIKPAPTDSSPTAQAVELEKAPSGLEPAWKTAKKPAAKPRKAAIEAEEEAVLKPASAPKVAAAPKPALATTPKPAKKPTKAWVDPFAQ